VYNLNRDVEIFRKISINPNLPVFCDTETQGDEGLSSGGLYGKVRLFQLFQEHWEKAEIIDCDFIPIKHVLDLLEDNHLVFHGGSFDLHTINLYTDKTWCPKKLDDTLYLSRLKFFTKQKFGFYECLKYSKHSDSLVESIDKKEEQKSDWSGALTNKQLIYAAIDVVYLSKLYESVKEFSTTSIYALDMSNLKYAINYSRNGMYVNQKKVVKLKKKFIINLEETLKQLPHDLNVRSSKQCCEYLNSKSSSKEVLTELAIEGNDNAQKIITARHCLKSLEYLNKYNRSIIKGFFNPCAAISGRFSCTGGNRYDHENLQQIPREFQEVITSPQGYKIVYKDYSGLELRMAVAYTGEELMGSMMKAGEDMHTYTAKHLFEKDEVSFEERLVAKAFNFGLIYGIGVKAVRLLLKLRANTDISFDKVKKLMNKWFELYEGFAVWHDMHKYQYNIYGYVDVETALGRKIRTYSVPDSLNYPIQGSSAEVTKVSLGLLYSKYPDVYLINTVHDANLLLAKDDEAEMWGKRLDECMIDAWKYVISDLADPDVPMPEGYDIGNDWIFK